MYAIIDVPSDVGTVAGQLAAAGVKTVIRYYNHHNSQRLPSKCLSRNELQALYGAGLSVAVVFEQGGGAGANITDLSEANGELDAARALALAAEMEQPTGSAIYFAVDWDFFTANELSQITPYFQQAKLALSNRYRVGVYGSGAVGQHLRQAGLVDCIWLAGSTGWFGTDQALADGTWTIFQKQLDLPSDFGSFNYDGNVFNPSFADFGQFTASGISATPPGEGSAALFKVIARSGLHLRSGPGDTYRVLDTLPSGAIVTGLGQEGPWVKVDVKGDGQTDGYMFGTFLQAVSGGLPIQPGTAELPQAPGALLQPIDVARAEMSRGVSGIPGPRNNPRIVMYHATTKGGAAPDETAWCSSFVNFCVEQTGLHGTDSKVALSWHEQNWGDDVTAGPQTGDVVVFRRDGPRSSGGHVGFWLGQSEDKIRILGGNQGNAISIANFPKDGNLGETHYKLASIRRA
jgi:uncharacterized protein (TIGR02594 family)